MVVLVVERHVIIRVVFGESGADLPVWALRAKGMTVFVREDMGVESLNLLVAAVAPEELARSVQRIKTGTELGITSAAMAERAFRVT